jgi:hypothetical protein
MASGCRLLVLLEQQPDFLAWADYAVAAQLRRTCRAARAAVARFPWDLDQNISRIAGARDPSRRPKAPYGNFAYEYIANWRRCCPRAVRLTVDKTSLLHGDGAALAGLRRLEIRSEVGERVLRLLSGRSGPDLEFDLDGALAHARSLVELRVECGGVATVRASACAFVALAQLKRLELVGELYGDRRAPARSLDALFAPLAALESLTVTDFGRNLGGALGGAPLAGLRCLTLRRCPHVALTDDVLEAMAGLLELALEGCPGAALSPRAFAGRAQLRALTLDSCARVELDDGAFAGLVSLRALRISGCRARLTGAFRRDLPADCSCSIVCDADRIGASQ